MGITAADIATALIASAISFEVDHPGTINESFTAVRASDGRAVLFSDSDSDGGVDVVYLTAGVGSDARTFDHITAPSEITDLVAFLSA